MVDNHQLCHASQFYPLFCKESLPKEDRKNKTDDAEHERPQVVNILKSSLSFVFDGLKTIVKPREGYKRVLVFLGLFNYFCYITGFTGTEGSNRESGQIWSHFQ